MEPEKSQPVPDAPDDGQPGAEFIDSLLGDDVPIRAIEVNYCVICPRKCWLFLHRLEQEAKSDLVTLGRLLHQTAFRRHRQRDVNVEGFARIDFTAEGIVHEVKHGSGQHRAHVLQVAYYLRLLRQRGIETRGVIHYPRQRRREVVELTPDLEAELNATLEAVNRIRSMPTPPSVPGRMTICRSCAYDEFCWGDDFDEDRDT